MARLGEITVKLDAEQMQEIHDCYKQKIDALRKALRHSLHVMEKGIEVRMMDQWPALKPILPDAIELAKKTLRETE